MLYEGSLELIEAASALRLPTAIATNGTRIAAAAERLVQAPMFLLQLSIDGPDAALHNQARPGVGGADNFADIQAALAAVGEAKRAHGSTLPLVASLTTISQTNFRHLVDIYEAFRDKVDLFVFYLSWWIDAERCEAHEADFRRRFGFTPVRPRGWVGGWKPDDYRELNRQLEAVLERSRPGTAPAVTLIPSITGEDNLRVLLHRPRELLRLRSVHLHLPGRGSQQQRRPLALPGLPRLCGGEHQRGHHHRALELPGLP